MSRSIFMSQTGALVAATAICPIVRAQPRKLRFGMGPFLPTAEDTRKSFSPLFEHLPKQLGAPGFELAVSTDWAGLAVAATHVTYQTIEDAGVTLGRVKKKN
jgi:phosphonate transport system substrate-binding protein